MDELKAKHKKEIRAFESDKRTALKRVKSTSGKGKKLKEALAKAEKEWDDKLKTLLQKHEEALSELQGQDARANGAEDPANTDEQEQEQTPDMKKEPELTPKEKALAKKMRKRQKALEKEKAREEEIAREMANAPDPRQLELDAIMELHLSGGNMEIEEVAADGNCLYRAIAKQMEYIDDSTEYDYIRIRHACAEEMKEKREEYEHFADLAEMKVENFEEYVEKVRDSSEWGGHLELRALAQSLKKTIIVYSTEAPLEIKTDGGGGIDDEGVIRLSFHRQYYALGEHYNSVVKQATQ